MNTDTVVGVFDFLYTGDNFKIQRLFKWIPDDMCYTEPIGLGYRFLRVCLGAIPEQLPPYKKTIQEIYNLKTKPRNPPTIYNSR